MLMRVAYSYAVKWLACFAFDLHRRSLLSAGKKLIDRRRLLKETKYNSFLLTRSRCVMILLVMSRELHMEEI